MLQKKYARSSTQNYSKTPFEGRMTYQKINWLFLVGEYHVSLFVQDKRKIKGQEKHGTNLVLGIYAITKQVSREELPFFLKN